MPGFKSMALWNGFNQNNATEIWDFDGSGLNIIDHAITISLNKTNNIID